MTYADLSLSRNYSIFGRLGYQGRDLEKPVVPLRGWPKTNDGKFIGDVAWGFERQATGLVIRGKAAEKIAFDEYGQFRESDGVVLSEEGAQRWLRYGSQWLIDQHSADEELWQYRRISHPDIHSVNWVTADELAKAINAASYVDVGYLAALAAMRELAKKPDRKMVRFIYGFDN